MDKWPLWTTQQTVALRDSWKYVHQKTKKYSLEKERTTLQHSQFVVWSYLSTETAFLMATAYSLYVHKMVTACLSSTAQTLLYRLLSYFEQELWPEPRIHRRKNKPKTAFWYLFRLVYTVKEIVVEHLTVLSLWIAWIYLFWNEPRLLCILICAEHIKIDNYF